MSKVWVLTSEVNDYNQYGEYFIGVFLKKPTVFDLLTFGLTVDEATNAVENGGGRMHEEETWWNLFEEDAL